MGEAATIELPRGNPGAVSDAGAALARVGGRFDRAGGAVAVAVSAVGSWQGSASVAFHDRAAGYEQALGSVDGVLAQARGALRRYEGELADTRERVRALRREEEEECVGRLELEQRRLEDAGRRIGAAGDRATRATLAGGLGDPFSLAAQAGAQRDLDQAEADARRAERGIARERDELDRLRREAVRERESVEEAERSAAAAVRQAAGDLPDVRLPTGEVSPPALTGTPFGPFTLSDFDRRVAAAAATTDTDEEDDDGSLLGKVVHGSLDGLGFVPGLGAVPDGINAGIYALEGDEKNAAISAGAAIPIFGDIGKGGKILADGTKALSKHGDEAAQAGAKGSDEVGGAGTRAGSPPPRQMVTTPRATTFDIPQGYVAREAENGQGIVYQRPGAPGNAGSIRIMEPTPDYPNGYFRYYNNEGRGQPLGVDGKPGSPSAIHIPEDFAGPLQGWPR